MSWTPEAAAEVFRRNGQEPPADLGAITTNKYGARKKEVDGIVFASTAEAKAYQNLKVQRDAGLIADLKLQPRFLLQEAFRDEAGKKHRRIEYVADFEFLRIQPDHLSDTRIVVDVKGFRTPVFALKEKLFLAKYPTVRLEIWERGEECTR